MIDPAFGHWFAGFTDGEGCFDVTSVSNKDGKRYYYCRFTIGLRSDDRSILQEIHSQLGGIGRLWDKPAQTSTSSPQVTFSVCKKTDCIFLRDVFRMFPLRAKKAEDFRIWSQVLDLSLERKWDEHKHDTIAALKAQLITSRRFKEDCERVAELQVA